MTTGLDHLEFIAAIDLTLQKNMTEKRINYGN